MSKYKRKTELRFVKLEKQLEQLLMNQVNQGRQILDTLTLIESIINKKTKKK